MLRPTHRRRSSTMNSTSSNLGRQRRGSFATAAGDDMDVVHDETKSQMDDRQEQEFRPSHIKLRGRGGFSHPQRNRGNRDQDSLRSNPIDDLASKMSVLHFVPHSVRMARGRGRGRGGQLQSS
jgi:hypothetical protein